MSCLGYIGSKKSLLEFIKNSLSNHINLNSTELELSFSDLFAGTGVVGEYFYNNFNVKIISNDLEYYSYIINYSKLKAIFSKKLENIILKINNREYKYKNDELIKKTYSPYLNCERMYFTIENAEFIDYTISVIHNLFNENIIDNKEVVFLQASLISSLDKCANTASVYGAYLKKFKKSAEKNIILNPIHTNTILKKENIVYNKDALEIKIKTDILYLDPPYNTRQYSSNYSQLNFILKYDKDIEIVGKTGIIKNWNRSSFCSKKTIEKSITKILNNIDTKILAFSYNNEGLISKEVLESIFSKFFINIKLYEKEYKKFKSNIHNNKSNVIEYLFICDNNNTNNDE